jgi:hypothetical protein
MRERDFSNVFMLFICFIESFFKYIFDKNIFSNKLYKVIIGIEIYIFCHFYKLYNYI